MVKARNNVVAEPNLSIKTIRTSVKKKYKWGGVTVVGNKGRDKAVARSQSSHPLHQKNGEKRCTELPRCTNH